MRCSLKKEVKMEMMKTMATAMAMTAPLPQNSSETDTLKETAKMDCLERLLYGQGQATKAGEQGGRSQLLFHALKLYTSS